VKKFLSALMILSVYGCNNNINAPDFKTIDIRFRYGFNNELNTFEGTYQKDLIMDGTAVTDFSFTTAEQESILAKLQANDFFELPDTVKAMPMIAFEPNPGIQFLRVKHGDKDKTVSWYYPLPQDNTNSRYINNLVTFMIEIIESKPEYKALPPARGGYL
jgi:hypothetical protein